MKALFILLFTGLCWSQAKIDTVIDQYDHGHTLQMIRHWNDDSSLAKVYQFEFKPNSTSKEYTEYNNRAVVVRIDSTFDSAGALLSVELDIERNSKDLLWTDGKLTRIEFTLILNDGLTVFRRDIKDGLFVHWVIIDGTPPQKQSADESLFMNAAATFDALPGRDYSKNIKF